MFNTKKFISIFQGLERSYGQHQSTTTNGNGEKEKGKNWFPLDEKINVPISKDIELWKKHLEGKEPSLGIVPINDNNECKWGCIDIDAYGQNINHKDLIKQIRDLKLPLIMCRSKSGGAHVFLFTSKFIKAESMRKTLTSMAVKLGKATAEIFPKQEKIRESEKGNFLNLPYFQCNLTMRYAIKDDGESATLNEFYEMYDKYVLSKDKIIDLNKNDEKKSNENDIIPNGPPCLQQICSNKIKNKTRNTVLFNVAIYLRKVDPVNWHIKLQEYNIKYCEDPLDTSELILLQKSIEKKDYDAYQCKQEPLCSHCNKPVCRIRKYGIGKQQDELIFGNVTCYDSDPPVFYWIVEGLPVKLTSKQFNNQKLFEEECWAQIRKVHKTFKPEDWFQLRKEKEKKITTIEVPEDLKIEGKLKAHLEDFCISGLGEGESLEDIQQGRAYTNKETNKITFRANHFINYLQQRGLKIEDGHVYKILRERLGAIDKRPRIAGVQTRCWELNRSIFPPSLKKKHEERYKDLQKQDSINNDSTEEEEIPI